MNDLVAEAMRTLIFPQPGPDNLLLEARMYAKPDYRLVNALLIEEGEHIKGVGRLVVDDRLG